MINALFEASAAVFVWLNFKALKRDRKVLGMHWIPITIFVIWGYWNPYYYWHLAQWLSMIAAVGVAVGNSAWLWLLWRIKKGD